jgi:hypothetical protein
MTTIINGSSPSVTFSDGTVQTTAYPTNYTLGFKNRFINGGMTIAQRATSATVTAGTAVPTASTGYPCVDRWFSYSTGANVTVAQVAGSGNNSNNLQVTGAGSVTAVGVGQRIESANSYDMAGQTVTLSVNISNSLLTTVTWTASYANTSNTFGTIAVPTKTQIATGTFTVTSTLTNYSTQISIPSAATTGIEILFTVGAQTSGTWVIGTAQLELGSAATAFDFRDYGSELLRCQRYYAELNNDGTGTAVGLGAGVQATTTLGTVFVKYPITMRSEPTISFFSVAATNYIAWDAAATLTSSFPGYASAGVSFSFSANGTGGSPVFLNIAANTAGYIDFSAEL